MAENENVMTNESAAKPSKGKKFLAAVKEWGRKQIVSLKRAPQRIYFVAMAITSILYLLWLFTFSRAIDVTQAAQWTGISVFINTLLSILVLALYFSAFPKRKKPSIVFVVLLFVFMAALVAFDIIFYIQEGNYLKIQGDAFIAKFPYLQSSLTYAIVHIVLVGICAILLATLPLYKKLILKINTRKVIETTEIKEAIDVEED